MQRVALVLKTPSTTSNSHYAFLCHPHHQLWSAHQAQHPLQAKGSPSNPWTGASAHGHSYASYRIYCLLTSKGISQLAGAFTVETLVWGFPNTYGVFLSVYLEDPRFGSQAHASSLLPLVGTLSSGIIYCSSKPSYFYPNGSSS